MCAHVACVVCELCVVLVLVGVWSCVVLCVVCELCVCLCVCVNKAANKVSTKSAF